MRHSRKVNHLGRTSSHRKAMLANMATSLILHKRIKTTKAKARALRTFVEPLITKSKEDSTHSRRVVFDYLQSKEAVSELFREVSPKIIERPGGYTRILKIGTRVGDSADMCIIELVDFNENMLSAKAGDTGKAGKRKRRGSKKKGEGETVKAETVAVESNVEEQKPQESAAVGSNEQAVAEETAPEITDEVKDQKNTEEEKKEE